KEIQRRNYVTVEDGAIVLHGKGSATVYSASGTKVAAANGGDTISNLAKGMYIIRFARRTFKIRL
ncbi:MAG: hypothetical protein K2G09_07950, partial [Paramuribaculum sp.]|nr:hypothetical protein [Paramuribaculum sp.]